MRFFKYCIVIFLLPAMASTAVAQNGCEIKGVKGQTPASAILVCSNDIFIRDTVPDCLNYPIPAPGCRIVGIGDYKDKNPFWFTFTCYASGTLEFLIDPNDPTDDYNWQFYDITGHGASEIYSDGALVREANWSGSTGKTGASTSGANARECESSPNDNVPTFSKPPDIIEGHTYLLLVSHYYDGTQSGFKLSFKGGSASITNPAIPGLQKAAVNCDGTQVGIKLTKKMNCATIASDGSDFEIVGLSGVINAAGGIECSIRYNTDSAFINLNNPLPPGNYTLSVKKGSDNNTLLDNCGNAIDPGNAVGFTVFAKQPVALDSMVTPSCAPTTLQLVFQKNIRCSSVAADGSDFTIDGPYPVTVTGAKSKCINDLSDGIELQLAEPILHEGTYTLTLSKGTDGNAITDPCNLETPAGATINFNIHEAVSADFNYRVKEGCRYDTVQYFNALENAQKSWNWQFDNSSSTEQNPAVIYNSFGYKTTRLIVNNGACSDTAVADLLLDHDILKAAFNMPSILCPADLAYFKDTSTGNITSWRWRFGNGISSNLQNPPPQVYPTIGSDYLQPVQLIIQNDKACFDTATQFLKVLNNCYIAVPSAFSPNNDGRNDYLYPLNAYKTINLDFKIFNRNGQLLFSTTDWTQKWDGTYNHEEQPPGTYTWFLQYTSTETGKMIFQKGTTVLIR